MFRPLQSKHVFSQCFPSSLESEVLCERVNEQVSVLGADGAVTAVGGVFGERRGDGKGEADGSAVAFSAVSAAFGGWGSGDGHCCGFGCGRNSGCEVGFVVEG